MWYDRTSRVWVVQTLQWPGLQQTYVATAPSKAAARALYAAQMRRLTGLWR